MMTMKNKALLLFAAIALIAACGKDNTEGTALDGKWIAHTGTTMDRNHPIDITFSGNTYIWHVGGYSPMKEEGTFTYENDIITLKGNTFWTCEVDWSQSQQQGGAPVESGAWVKAELIFPSHKYKVLSFEADVLTVEQLEDDIISKGITLVMTRGESFPAESELKGTWEGTSDSGKQYRISFDGKKFTRWEVYSQYGKLAEDGDYVTFNACIKESGTWKYAKGELTLTPDHRWNSYIIHANQYGTPLYYEVSPINETTLEAETWWEITGGDLWESTWALTKVAGDMYVEVKYTNMDFFVMKKK